MQQTLRKSMTNRLTASSHNSGIHGGLWALADSHAIFVRNLRFWLGNRNVKAAELARRLGKNQSTISQWLSDVSSPDLKTIGRIADILKIPVSYLFQDDDDEEKHRHDGDRPAIGETERALKLIAKKVGLKIRIEPK